LSKFAEVIIDIAYNKLDRPFTYKVPGRMQDVLQPGSLVMVPFGKANVIRKGYVIALKDECGYDPDKVKEIAELPVNDSGYSEDDDGATAIALAAWMKRRYGSTMAAALKTVLTSRKPGKPVRTREIELAMPREEAEKQLEIYVRKHQVARERLLRELLEVPRQPYSLVTGKLHINIFSKFCPENIKRSVLYLLQSPVSAVIQLVSDHGHFVGSAHSGFLQAEFCGGRICPCQSACAQLDAAEISGDDHAQVGEAHGAQKIHYRCARCALGLTVI
jgi:primosomal protein N'